MIMSEEEYMVGDQPALDMQQAAQELGVSSFTLNSRIRRLQIRRYPAGGRNKLLILRSDLERIRTLEASGVEPETEVKPIQINGKDALNLTDAAVYMQMTTAGLRKRLARHPEIKLYRIGSDNRQRYVYVEDLDKMNEPQEIEP